MHRAAKWPHSFMARSPHPGGHLLWPPGFGETFFRPLTQQLGHHLGHHPALGQHRPRLLMVFWG